jgi:uncharacterized membrane protein YgaE (UPF0421/DUF939 family)
VTNILSTEELQKNKIIKLEQEISGLKKQIEFLKEKDEFFTNHYLGVREMYNKELRKLDNAEIRIIIAKEADKDRNDKTYSSNS